MSDERLHNDCSGPSYSASPQDNRTTIGAARLYADPIRSSIEGRLEANVHAALFIRLG